MMIMLTSEQIATIARYVVAKETASDNFNRIETIKIFRRMTGLSLKHSKDVVELILNEAPPKDPIVAYLDEHLRKTSDDQDEFMH
jgi:ribosomal protein L7/L12